MADAIGNLFGGAHNWSDNQNNEGQGDGRSGGRSNGGRGRYDEGGGGVAHGVKVRGQQPGALLGGLELNVQLNYNKEFQPPEHWANNGETFVPIRKDSEEYRKVSYNFNATLRELKGKMEILQIKRIENPSYYEKYSIHRAHVAKKLGKMLSEVEKVLWHGTLEHLADIIANSKFDRGYAGARRKDGFSSNGKGCYFATETHYSAHDGYCTANDYGERFIFQVRVVTGDVGQGEEGLRVAPDKPDGGQYDSVVDKKVNPRMYVVFDDCAAYPEYLIKFRDA